MSNVTATQVPGEEPATTQPEAVKRAPSRRTPVTKADLAAAEGSLPSQSEVDPDKISRAVLTVDGWVCPTPKQNPAQRA